MSNALVSKKDLHVAQVGSAFVEQKRRRRVPKGMCGNNRHRDGSQGNSERIQAHLQNGAAFAGWQRPSGRANDRAFSVSFLADGGSCGFVNAFIV
jgi:hypothetical protein